MTTTFTAPASLLPRLTTLHHAADRLSPGAALAHINLRVDDHGVSFAATDGRLLAVVRDDAEDREGGDVDVLLDVRLFTAACSTLGRADRSARVRCTIDAEAQEARLTRGVATAVVRLLAMPFPPYEHVLDRIVSRHLVPSLATFDPALLSTVVKLVGKGVRPLLWSPTENEDLPTTWGAAILDEDVLSVRAVRALIDQPGIWSDGTLLVLIMPIRRTMTGVPDLASFVRGEHSATMAALGSSAA